MAATTPIIGVSAVVTMGSQTTIPITGWTLAGSCGVIDATHTGCGGHTAVVPGLIRWAGTFGIILDSATSDDILDELEANGAELSSIILYKDGTTPFATWTNTIVDWVGHITSSAVSQNVEGVVRVEFAFIVNGTATLAD